MKKSSVSLAVFALIAALFILPWALSAQEPAEEIPVPEDTAQDEPASPQENELENMTLEERLDQPISLDLRNIDILEALKFLASKGNLNIVASKNVSGRVTFTLDRVPLRDIFDLTLRSNGLAYVKHGDIYNIMTEAEYKALYGKNFADIREVKMLRLKYAVPDQAFALLDALKSEVGRVVVDQESGNVLIMDTPARAEEMEKALAEFERENIVEVFSLKFAKAKDVEEVLKTRLDAKKVGSIKADERSNQIIVQALDDRMEEIRRLIRGLDKNMREVIIDTKIIKITLSDRLDSGVEWEGIFNLINTIGGGTGYLGTYPFSSIPAGVTNPTFQTRQDFYTSLNNKIGGYPFSGTTSTLNASTKVSPGEQLHLGFFQTSKDFDVLLKLLNTIGESRILSNPKLVAVNNQEAKIHIGERQAYVTTTTTTGQTTNTISEQVNFVDVGIQLSVTPTINDDGYVTMKIKPEISSVTSTLVTPTNNRIPIVDTSLAETTVMIKDGMTLVVGGLRREEKVHSSDQVPILGKIPFFGYPFRNSTSNTIRTELVILLTPHIVTGDTLTTGDDRPIEAEPGKEYREYPPLGKEPVSGDTAPEIQPMLYRDLGMESGLQEDDSGLLAKGQRYDYD
ncbi:MAG: secretin N-terminal domain-containing protein [Candidatus Omnitrophica bacterium]|nr:secretin N-terminal domain-containing protein [Candidatus Omnitrophota bacterium]MDD5553253.1 secretin N-terminal domain-containing protein [Candidatus Omnitrophota bacterium]